MGANADLKNEIVFKVFGVTEKSLNDKFNEIGQETPNAEFSYENNLLDFKVKLTCENKREFDKAANLFTRSFYENIYADFEAELQEVLVSILKIGKLTISVAESFTGGNLSAKIVSVPGASEVFYEGVVAYASEAKIKRLGVLEQSVLKNKPVSSQVAGEMASGLLKNGASDLAVATTGLAGPLSDESGFPVGLCFIAVGSSVGISVYKYMFDGTRREITEKGVQTALFLAIKSAKNI